MASQNVETVRAYLDAAFRHDYPEAGRYIGEGYTWIDRAEGIVARTPEEQAEAQEEEDAWSDRTLEIERVMETTDGAVVVQMASTATHSGTWRSIPATGRRARWTYCVVFGFDPQGRIVSEDSYHDHLTLMVQLGAIELPG